MYTVEEPGSRTNCPAFTEKQARQFLSTWCRVVEADGSTVAYVPDLPTARLFAAAPALAQACNVLLDALAAAGRE